ncbi:hypothetical protein O6H91_23G047500 [Diphasiastrum complanatum]|uniref:Uncharacterized protein n=1 Tax=Diphasiastrum complanatum TaxID=34168 RepID=A0ACC2AAE7_DIPCM|nr:hypothetical protein O6H91_23G047500 [Diphasiastrum complanatum]
MAYHLTSFLHLLTIYLKRLLVHSVAGSWKTQGRTLKPLGNGRMRLGSFRMFRLPLRPLYINSTSIVRKQRLVCRLCFQEELHQIEMDVLQEDNFLQHSEEKSETRITASDGKAQLTF